MRAVALLAFASGCRAIFGIDDPQRVSDAMVSEDGVVVDAPSIDAPDVVACGPEPDLTACFDFEGTVVDSSGNQSVNAINVTFAQGKLGMAARFDTASRFIVGDNPSLDVAAMTMQMWINAGELPSGSERAGLFDVDAQYGLFLVSGGAVRCYTSGPTQETAPFVVAAGTWTHVACTYGNGEVTIYVDGAVAVTGAGGPLDTTSTNGAELAGNVPSGDRFIGDIDLVRVYRVARDPASIAADAGR